MESTNTPLLGGVHPVMAQAMAPFLNVGQYKPYVYRSQHSLGIDVRTKSMLELVEQLKALPTTISVEFGGEYREDPSYCQVHVITKMTEAQMDDWLYASNGIDYVGVFQRGDAA